MSELSVHRYIIFFLVLLTIKLGFLLMKKLRMELLSSVMLMVYEVRKHMPLLLFNVFLETFARGKF